MKIYQWIYTCFNWNITKRTGFDVFSYSEGLSEQDLSELSDRHIAFPIMQESMKKVPLFYTFSLSSGKSVMIQSSYIGLCFDGRDGNFISHALISDSGEWPDYCACYYDSPTFWKELPDAIKEKGRDQDPYSDEFTPPDHLPVLSENELVTNPGFTFEKTVDRLHDRDFFEKCAACITAFLKEEYLSFMADTDQFLGLAAMTQVFLGKGLGNKISLLSFNEDLSDASAYSFINSSSPYVSFDFSQEQKSSASVRFLLENLPQYLDFQKNCRYGSFAELKNVIAAFLSSNKINDYDVDRLIKIFTFSRSNIADSNKTSLAVLRIILQKSNPFADYARLQEIHRQIEDDIPAKELVNEMLFDALLSAGISQIDQWFEWFFALDAKWFLARIRTMFEGLDKCGENHVLIWFRAKQSCPVSSIQAKMPADLDWRDLASRCEAKNDDLFDLLKLCPLESVDKITPFLKSLPSEAIIRICDAFRTKEMEKGVEKARVILRKRMNQIPDETEIFEYVLDKREVLTFSNSDLLSILLSMNFDISIRFLDRLKDLIGAADDKDISLLSQHLFFRLEIPGSVETKKTIVEFIDQSFSSSSLPIELTLIREDCQKVLSFELTDEMAKQAKKLKKEAPWAERIYQDFQPYLFDKARTSRDHERNIAFLHCLMDEKRIVTDCMNSANGLMDRSSKKIPEKLHVFLQYVFCDIDNPSEAEEELWADAFIQTILKGFNKKRFKQFLSGNPEFDKLCNKNRIGKRIRTFFMSRNKHRIKSAIKKIFSIFKKNEKDVER